MFKRDSVIDRKSNTFTDSRIKRYDQGDSCSYEDMKEATDDETIEWKESYSVEDTLTIKYCDNPDRYILISTYLPISVPDTLIAFTDGRKEWDTLVTYFKKRFNYFNLYFIQQLIENRSLGKNERGEEVWKESLYFQRYSCTKQLTFLFTRKIIEE